MCAKASAIALPATLPAAAPLQATHPAVSPHMIAATLQDHADAALRESIRWRVVVDRHDMLLALTNVAYDGKLVYACGLFDTQAKLQAPLGMMCEPALDAAWMQLRDRHAAVRQELEETLRQNLCRGVRATQDSRLIERLQNASRELRTLSVAQAASSPPGSHQARLKLRAARIVGVPWLKLSSLEVQSATLLGYSPILWHSELSGDCGRCRFQTVIWRERHMGDGEIEDEIQRVRQRVGLSEIDCIDSWDRSHLCMTWD